MDRKTAIKWIEQIKYRISGGDEYFDRQRKESLDMAIVDIKICDANNAGWISVKDRLPEEEGTYLVFPRDPCGVVTIAWYSGPEDGWLALDGNFYADGVVTHYMPRPEPPKEET